MPKRKFEETKTKLPAAPAPMPKKIPPPPLLKRSDSGQFDLWNQLRRIAPPGGGPSRPHKQVKTLPPVPSFEKKHSF